MKFLKDNGGLLIIIAINLIALVTFFNNLDSRIEANVTAIVTLENKLAQHKIAPDSHMTMEKKIETFVLRKEYEPTIDVIKDDLKIIKDDIKKILSRTN